MKRFCLLLALSLCVHAVAHEDLSDQIQVLTTKIKDDPDNALLYFQRGELFRARDAFQKAEADYLKAEELDPELYAVDLSMGLLELARGNTTEAETRFNKFLEHHPNHVQALIGRARALSKKGNVEAALMDYNNSLSIEPRVDLYLERSDMLSSTNRIEEALQGLDEGIRTMGSLVVLEEAAIKLDLKLKRFDSALRRIDFFIQKMERKEIWLVKRAEILEDAGRDQEALKAYETAAESIQQLPESRKNSRSVKELEKVIQQSIDRLN